MRFHLHVPHIPVSLFSIVLGLAGLGNSWRSAHQVWGLPAAIGEALMAVAVLIWAGLILLYALKWIAAPAEARSELSHPVQSSFVALAGLATPLVAGAVLPYSRLIAEIFFAVGGTATAGFAVWLTGRLWRGERDHVATTAGLYLPAGAGGFVIAIVAGAFGRPDWGQLAFGAGLFSWLSIESVLLHRLYTEAEFPVVLRPTLGIQIAPPAVGSLAYISVTSGVPDAFAHALIGYALFQTLVLLRLLPWLMRAPFAPSYWAYTFGLSALANAPLRLLARGDTGAIAALAPYLFAAVNIAIGVIAVVTLWQAMRASFPPRSAAATGAAAE